MRFYLAASALVLNLCTAAQAQVSIDATKITCDQFVHHKVGEPRVTGAWLSGYYHGRRDTRIIDLQGFEENLSKLTFFCQEEKNFKLPVMQAVEQVLGAGK